MTSTATATQATIDLRSIAPRDRHAKISARFAALQPGEALELVNDHDPQPLCAQFEDREFGRFDWRYLQTGPVTWRVRIVRSVAQATTAAVVAGDSCCSGGACCG